MVMSAPYNVQEIPHTPGVYLMKDSSGRIIYVGKAKDLKKRVSSYFLKNRDLKTSMLVNHIADIEYIITTNEYEALILENNLIKKWNPKYNISLKDGKTFPVIRITNEDFPRVFRTRRIVKDGSKYYGPYADVRKLDAYLELIDRIFPLRKCKGPLRRRYAPCLYYHIGKCTAPCAGKVTKEEYQQQVERVKAFLSGKTEELERNMKREMQQASADMAFERAAELRDTLIAIASVQTQQQVQDFTELHRDYAACVMKDQLCTISVFQMEEGKLLGREMFRAQTFADEAEALTEFIMQFYVDDAYIPRELYLSHEVDQDLIQTYFQQERHRHVRVHMPVHGKHRKIVNMAMENARQDVIRRQRAAGNTEGLKELKRVLELERLPKRIEGFDIAQLAGKYPVASLISFHDGNPDKKNYRRFHLKSLDGAIDDYEAVREAVARRYTRVINEELEQPDLIMIDGGKGQVHAAREILESLGLYHIPVIGLAKEFEAIYRYDRSEPILLPEGNEALRILQAVRDETHRFATSLNQKKREQESRFSVLEAIEGIGPVRSTRLMQKFGSIEALKAADPEEISAACKISVELARTVQQSL
jgi:excinuclease ABC subunit C